MWRAPAGRSWPPSAPSLARSSVMRAGRSTTGQCHQPEPLGASGSYTVTAKLCVPSGAPLQRSTGEALRPVQPKPLNSNSWAMVPLAGMSGLERTNAAMVGIAPENGENPMGKESGKYAQSRCVGIKKERPQGALLLRWLQSVGLQLAVAVQARQEHVHAQEGKGGHGQAHQGPPGRHRAAQPLHEAHVQP